MANNKQDSDDKTAAREIAFLNGRPIVQDSRPNGKGKGRPKGAKNRKTILREIANEMHTVRAGAARLRLTTLGLVMLRLRNFAVEGKKPRAFDEFQRLIKKYEPQAVNKRVGVLIVPAQLTHEEFIEMRKKNPPIHPKDRRSPKAEE